MIMTVSGPIPPTTLGFCHSHEHLFIADGQSAKVNPALRIDSLEKTIAELEVFKRIGGKCIVDAQPVGCGRMADLLFLASEASGVKIIAATGFHKLGFYPEDHWIRHMSEFKLAELFSSEFAMGMYVNGDHCFPTKRTKAKPGIIKAASDVDGITVEYRKLFAAAAMASIQTGLPILCHTEKGTSAMEQIRLFLDFGLPASSLIVCHLDRFIEDFQYHRQVAETGVYLEYDTIGRLKYHSDEGEAEHIFKMVECGYEDQILLGLDVTRERMKSYGGALGIDHLIVEFLPILKKAGLTNEVINKFMIHNPAKALAIQESYPRRIMS
jgi:predicted metal-dependent phosphotriesterase family hydrolase